jgi:hypothetical protein
VLRRVSGGAGGNLRLLLSSPFRAENWRRPRPLFDVQSLVRIVRNRCRPVGAYRNPDGVAGGPYGESPPRVRNIRVGIILRVFANFANFVQVGCTLQKTGDFTTACAGVIPATARYTMGSAASVRATALPAQTAPCIRYTISSRGGFLHGERVADRVGSRSIRVGCIEGRILGQEAAALIPMHNGVEQRLIFFRDQTGVLVLMKQLG